MNIFSRKKKIESINPNNVEHFSRLTASIDWSEKQLAYPRRKRIDAVKQYVGKHYMEHGSKKIMPINISKLAIDIYLRQLIARAPRVLVTTKRGDLKATAANFELALNQIPDEIQLGKTLKKFVLEALFGMGIVKVGLAASKEIVGQPYGQPFVDNVTLDNYFCDMTAVSFDNIQYEGNDYWMDYKEFMDSGIVDKKYRKDCKPDDYTTNGPDGSERAEGITNRSSADVYKDRIWLRDVWLPQEGLVLTYGVTSKKKFDVREWEGPDRGMYVKLGYTNVPGNLLPLPPVSIWYDLNELCNALLRKIGREADAYKRVLGFDGSDDAGVTAFKEATDGGGIKYTGRQPQNLEAGGVDPRTLATFLQMKQLTSYIAGNLDSLGGLSAMSQTIGQDQLLAASASAQLQDMAGTTVDAIKDIFYMLAYYEWTDPIKERELEKKIPDMGDMSIPVKWNKDEKQGDFDLYDLDIDVYSMQDNSPQTMLQKIGAVVNQYIMPLMPLIQQKGGVVDVEKILKDVAKYSDTCEYVSFADDLPESMQGAQGPSYTSTAQKTPEQPQSQPSGDNDLMNQLMSMK
jgi:hypothetical protein